MLMKFCELERILDIVGLHAVGQQWMTIGDDTQLQITGASARHKISCSCYLWPWLAFSDDIAILHVLPVLWMTSCLSIIARHRRRQ